MMIIYKLTTKGELYASLVCPTTIQKEIDKLIKKLGSKYYSLEEKCKQSSLYQSMYRELFARNAIDIPESVFDFNLEMRLPEYEYFKDVYFDNNYAIHNRFVARINHQWVFRYLVQPTEERLPLPIIQMIEKRRQQLEKENHELDLQDIPK